MTALRRDTSTAVIGRRIKSFISLSAFSNQNVRLSNDKTVHTGDDEAGESISFTGMSGHPMSSGSSIDTRFLSMNVCLRGAYEQSSKALI